MNGDWVVATPLEHLQAMGFQVGSGDKQHPIQKIAAELELRAFELKHLIGNGMHLHSIGCWMSFVLSNLERADGAELCGFDASPKHRDFAWRDVRSFSLMQVVGRRGQRCPARLCRAEKL